MPKHSRLQVEVCTNIAVPPALGRESFLECVSCSGCQNCWSGHTPSPEPQTFCPEAPNWTGPLQVLSPFSAPELWGSWAFPRSGSGRSLGPFFAMGEAVRDLGRTSAEESSSQYRTLSEMHLVDFYDLFFIKTKQCFCKRYSEAGTR